MERLFIEFQHFWWMSHLYVKAASMKSRFDEKSLQWKAALMKSHFDEKPLWWKAASMKSRFDEKPLRWKAASMKSRFDEKLLQWKAASMKSCFDEKPLRWKATPPSKKTMFGMLVGDKQVASAIKNVFILFWHLLRQVKFLSYSQKLGYTEKSCQWQTL